MSHGADGGALDPFAADRDDSYGLTARLQHEVFS